MYDGYMTHSRKGEADIALPLLTESGYLERPLSTAGWFGLGKRAVLDGDFLTFDPDATRGPHRSRVTSNIGMLDGFRRLADGPDRAILAYARRWGFLSVCSHGVRDDHEGVVVPERLVEPRGTIEVRPEGHYDGVQRERLDVWRYWSSQADALLTAMVRLRDGRVASTVEWKPLWRRGPWTEVLEAHLDAAVIRAIDAQWLDAPAPPKEGQRWRIAAALEAWMRIGGMAMTVAWTSNAAALGFESPTLLGTIGLQLALAATGAESFAACSDCGAPFASGKRPRADRRNYCPTCQDAKVAARNASRRYRARQREMSSSTPRRRQGPSVPRT